MPFRKDETLENIFINNKNTPFIFIRPGGNWGDELIYWGAEHLAESVGLNWRSEDIGNFNPERVLPSEAIYLHGGGGFNSWCSGNAALALKNALTSPARLVVQGPQTFDNSDEYISNLVREIISLPTRKEIFIFSRERNSLDLLHELLPAHIDYGLDIDTALHLTKEIFLERTGKIKPRYDFIALREDNEAAINATLNKKGVTLDPSLYASSFDHWLRIHAAARSIVTNRTHSSVAGAILGTPTVLLAGSYHKNKSIWEYSLKERGVGWGEYDQNEKMDKNNFLYDLLPNRVKHSWKVQTISNWLKGVPLP